MKKFKVTESPIKGLLLIEPTAFADDRGFFMECYNQESFAEFGVADPVRQTNQSLSKKGVVRGMHYQILPDPMGKLVKVYRGKIFDAGIDIRRGSPTFGQWFGDILSAENHKMLYLPPGFAHGFLALEDETIVVYNCTGVYTPPSERAIVWNDPDVGIKWPLHLVGQAIVSLKDQQNPPFKKVETNFIYQQG